MITFRGCYTGAFGIQNKLRKIRFEQEFHLSTFNDNIAADEQEQCTSWQLLNVQVTYSTFCMHCTLGTAKRNFKYQRLSSHVC